MNMDVTHVHKHTECSCSPRSMTTDICCFISNHVMFDVFAMNKSLCHSQTENPCCCHGTGSWPVSSSSCVRDGTPGSSLPAQRWGRSGGVLSVGREVHRRSLGTQTLTHMIVLHWMHEMHMCTLVWITQTDGFPCRQLLEVFEHCSAIQWSRCVRLFCII